MAYSAGVSAVKAITIVVLFGLAMCIGLLPSKWKKMRENPQVLSYANAFAGGLFLGIGLFHILPEAVEEFAQYQKENSQSSSFPVIFFTAACSYSFILFLDRVAFRAHSEVHHDSPTNKPVISELSVEYIDKAPVHWDAEDSDKFLHVHKDQVSDHDNVEEAKSTYILILALSIHAIFEGLAVGLSKNLAPTLNLAAAMCLHKWAEALTIGVSFINNGVGKYRSYIMLFIFSISSPVGIAIGWLLTEAPLALGAVLKATTTGTFLYLSATEIANEEFSSSNYGIIRKFFFFLAGLVLVTLATLVE